MGPKAKRGGRTGKRSARFSQPRVARRARTTPGAAAPAGRPGRDELLLRLEHGVTRDLASAASAHDGLKGALRAVGETEGWDCAEFWRFEDADGRLRRFEYWAAPRVDTVQRFADASRGVALAPGEGLVGAVWQSGRPLWIPDAASDPRAFRGVVAGQAGLRAGLLFPVRYGGRVEGVLNFVCREIRQPEERLLQALEVIATQIGQFLQRTRAEQALRESEARFRSLTDLSSDWYWEQDEGLRFTHMSGTFADKTGIAVGTFIGKQRWDRPALNLSEADWERHRAQLERHEPFRDFEMQRLRPDGRSAWVSVSGEPMFDADGRFKGYRGVGRDLTERKRVEDDLRRFRVAMDSSADMITLIDRATMRYIDVNAAMCELLGYTRAELLALSPSDLLPANRAELERAYDQLIANPALAGRITSTLRRKDGTLVPFDATRTVHLSGNVATVVVVSRDARERIAAERALRESETALRDSEARFRSLTQMSSDFFWETDAQHLFTELVHGPNYVARFGTVIVGKTAWELPYTMPDESGWARLRATIEAREPIREFEFGRPRADGGARYFSVSGEPRYAPGGAFLGYRGVGRDITEIVLAREHIASLAYSDPLTGLANRTSLGPAFEQAVERSRRRNARLATLFIDLDGFKEINDAHGHPAGDRFLVEVGRRLRSCLRASDLVARLGGDEFFVVLEDVQESTPVDTVARKLLSEIRRPFELAPGTQASTSASIGISLFPDDAADAATLMRQADTAMYRAKDAGKDAFRYFADGEGAAQRATCTS